MSIWKKLFGHQTDDKSNESVQTKIMQPEATRDRSSAITHESISEAELAPEYLAGVKVVVASGSEYLMEIAPFMEESLREGRTVVRHDHYASALVEFANQGHDGAIGLIRKIANCPVALEPGSSAALAVSIAHRYVSEAPQGRIVGADNQMNVAKDEPWEKYRQYVSLPSCASDLVMTSRRSKMQFMFPSMATANKTLTSLPKELFRLLNTGRMSDSFDPQSKKYVVCVDGVVMTLDQAKAVMNHVVMAGGEIYEAFLD